MLNKYQILQWNEKFHKNVRKDQCIACISKNLRYSTNRHKKAWISSVEPVKTIVESYSVVCI